MASEWKSTAWHSASTECRSPVTLEAAPLPRISGACTRRSCLWVSSGTVSKAADSACKASERAVFTVSRMPASVRTAPASPGPSASICRSPTRPARLSRAGSRCGKRAAVSVECINGDFGDGGYGNQVSLLTGAPSPVHGPASGTRERNPSSTPQPSPPPRREEYLSRVMSTTERRSKRRAASSPDPADPASPSCASGCSAGSPDTAPSRSRSSPISRAPAG